MSQESKAAVNEEVINESKLSQKSNLFEYFTSVEWVTFFVLVIIGVALRWGELEVRPYHHDESQHAMFGKYFFDFPEIQYYKYDPMMHAPLLYNFYRLVYAAFGNTLWSARAPIALIGSIFLIVPLLFRRYFSPTALLALTGGIALSPSMVYWSRFVIHDFFVISAMLITLYGVVIAAPQRKSFFVLLGLSLQFCIKANIFVTIALLAGFLIYEAIFEYLFLDRSNDKWRRLKNYLINYSLSFLVIFGLLVMALHYLFVRIDPDDKDWGALGYLAQHTFLFLGGVALLALFCYLLSFFIFTVRNTQIRVLIKNISAHKLAFLVALSISIFVFCYIFSSGFRFNQGILDGLYRTSIPYWLHQHGIERIKGPFLFNFYTFCWYDLALVIFFFIQTLLFYRDSGVLTKAFGLIVLGLASFLSLGFLIWTSPGNANSVWLTIEDLSNKDVTEYKNIFSWLAYHFVKFFKLKDCLDIFGLILCLIHPVILTSTHLMRGEKKLAFWGYLFTASFFAYSYLGEKVPWLSMYPLVVGFVYLTLYFDDWFKRNPINEFRRYPLVKIFKISSLVLLSLGAFFTLETIFSLTSVLKDFSIGKLWYPFSHEGRDFVSDAIKSGFVDNMLIFILGLLLYVVYFLDRWINLLSSINLKVFLFVIIGLFSLRVAILANYVYAGSETEYISQVHTTREFHNVMLELRALSERNLRAEPIKILGDGDPVWPMTWYMVGISEFRFSATQEERRDFDYILQTYDDNVKDMPEGFEKRRITLRGWWVPDFNQMTLKKFLNAAINHVPWSPSGFTYAWLMRNTNKR